ncbi:MAG: phosphate signaling complex protein PhoU [Chlamydiae bacterium]|nr:phosphate signaling complex protein PhoU [Chlamydiota bacterium]MBI3266444.1 phosphate signaling complex protein PhoU [Chlamydiota bacterium]
MQRHFDEELGKLKQELLRMGGLVEDAISLSVKALVNRDEVMTEGVVRSDDVINMLEIEIEEMCFRLLALHQPAGSDLRLIIMVMKIVNDLERMGDLAVNIAERTLDLLKKPLLKPLIDIPRMANLAQKMVKDSLDAFVNQDAKLARSVCERDDEVDDLNDQIFRELLTYMLQDSSAIERAVDLILIGRHLERIADHATNIGEDVIYLVQGKTIKHHLEERNLKK